MRPKVADSAAFNTQVSILEQLPPHDPLSAHVQVLVVNNQQPPEAHTVLAQAQQRFGSHRSVRFASSPNCNPVYSRLQPCVLQTATLCTPGCNPVYSRLQPCVLQAATLCTPGALRRQTAANAPAQMPWAAGRLGRGHGERTQACSKCHLGNGATNSGRAAEGPNGCGPEARQQLRVS